LQGASNLKHLKFVVPYDTPRVRDSRKYHTSTMPRQADCDPTRSRSWTTCSITCPRWTI